MRGGTSASWGPGAVRPGAARHRAVRMIAPELAFGDGAGRSRYYIVRFRRCPVGNSGQTAGVTLFKAKNKQVNVLARKPAQAGLTGPRSWDVMTIISAYPPSRSLSSEPERTRWLRRRVQGMRRSARDRLP
jgi:hypothetical protein